MATDIPPHNLREVASACIHLLDEPGGDARATLCEHVQGPGLPDRRRDHHAARRAARRSTRPATAACRARARVVQGRRRQHRHHARCRTRCRRRKVQEQIAAADAREEAADGRGHPRRVGPREPDPHRASCRARTASTSTQLMAHLFATTDLERSYRVNLNMIGLDGRPQVEGPASELLTEWLRVPHRHGHAPPAAPPREGRAPPAPARRPADRLPQPRRGDPHHPHARTSPSRC